MTRSDDLAAALAAVSLVILGGLGLAAACGEDLGGAPSPPPATTITGTTTP
ncbi:MAG: hypothetical protein ACRD0U_17570 [Acidimicrobiales bacterium]